MNVVNRTPYMYPVEVKADGRSVATVPVQGGQTRELCLAQPSADGKMLVVLRSVMMPIGSCLLASGGRMEIVREGEENDPVTRAYCR